ncbi:MAG: hypothetical protein LBL36_03460, partial [Clostridiales Family XIII bacterium]|nr:hypothetical protein [Clostridiales Family XIII bacterium]
MKRIRGILSTLIILALVASGGTLIFSQAQVARAAPFSDSVDSPRIAQPDGGGTGLQVAGEVMDFAGTHAFTAASADAKDKNKESESEKNDEKSDTNKSGANVAETGAVDGSLPGDFPQATDRETDTEYFTTSIKDGDTVRAGEYEFTIRHLVPALKVMNVQTSVNAREQSQWQGRISLDEGVNKVRVAVNYADADGKVIAVYRDYTLYYYPDKAGAALAIHTSLTATSQADPFIVHNAECEFQASVTGGSGSARLTVVFDGVTLKGDAGSYKAAIEKINRTVTVRLRAADPAGSADITEYYYVKYIPIADETTAPRVRYINVTNGMSITGEDYTLDVDPVDYRGNAIGYQGVAVRLNGTLTDMRWMNEYLSYALVFNDGSNRLDIRLTDSEGRSADYSYEITCKRVSDGEPL